MVGTAELEMNTQFFAVLLFFFNQLKALLYDVSPLVDSNLTNLR